MLVVVAHWAWMIGVGHYFLVHLDTLASNCMDNQQGNLLARTYSGESYI